jgi:methylmalonyl-CoA/ethylmalonyl-CoA epimerase
MFNRIRVIHVVVHSIEEAAKDYKERFGLEATTSGDRPDLGIRNAILPIGDAVIELIEPLDREEGPLPKFLQNRGEGVYMTGWEVDDIDEAVKSLQEKGVRLVNADPESRAKGAQVFLHPKSTHGVLIELVEKPK